MIDKAEVGELLFYRVEDELLTFRGQRRMNFAFGNGTTERFEEVEPQTFGLVCVAQARAVVVKVIPHNIEVGPRLFDVVCTDAGATEHVKDSAVFRQFARNFGEFPPALYGRRTAGAVLCFAFIPPMVRESTLTHHKE